jgi:hypothetical protein
MSSPEILRRQASTASQAPPAPSQLRRDAFFSLPHMGHHRVRVTIDTVRASASKLASAMTAVRYHRYERNEMPRTPFIHMSYPLQSWVTAYSLSNGMQHMQQTPGKTPIDGRVDHEKHKGEGLRSLFVPDFA